MIHRLLRKWQRLLDHLKVSGDVSTVGKGIQILLSLQYKELLSREDRLPSLDDVQFRTYSENGEDGILWYIFSLIGTTNKRVIEICAGDGVQCNAANLIINHGWIGLLFDGDKRNIDKGRAFYARCRETQNWPPKLVHAWLTTENINDLIEQNGFVDSIDLLSLDMDGVDYWILDAIDCIQPRVIVLEYQDILGPKRSVTVPYKSDFVATFSAFGPDYCGASLAAFVKLGKQKGYRLVGCERLGYNAFFLRDDVGIDVFPEIPVDQCFIHPRVQFGMKSRFPLVDRLEWVEV